MFPGSAKGPGRSSVHPESKSGERVPRHQPVPLAAHVRVPVAARVALVFHPGLIIADIEPVGGSIVPDEVVERRVGRHAYRFVVVVLAVSGLIIEDAAREENGDV